MTAPHDVATLDGARLRLDTAVAQLLTPSAEHIRRADGILDRHVAAQHAADRATTRELQGRLALHRAGGQDLQARLVVRQLRDHRRRVVARLVGAATTSTIAAVPSLLDQLLGAVAGSGGDNGTPGAGVHRAPVALGAVALLARMERTIRWGRIATGDLDPHPDVRVQLQRWASRAEVWRREHPDALLAAAGAAESWVGDIRVLLNPGRRTTITDPCPDCARTTAHVRDDEGQVVRRAALEVDLTHKVARCLACHSSWPPEFLARLLEQQRSEEAALA